MVFLPFQSWFLLFTNSTKMYSAVPDNTRQFLSSSTTGQLCYYDSSPSQTSSAFKRKFNLPNFGWTWRHIQRFSTFGSVLIWPCAHPASPSDDGWSTGLVKPSASLTAHYFWSAVSKETQTILFPGCSFTHGLGRLWEQSSPKASPAKGTRSKWTSNCLCQGDHSFLLGLTWILW